VTSFSSSALLFLVFLALFFGVMPRYAAEVPFYWLSDRFGGGRLLCGKMKE